ncbi:class III signal peptide-containing protein [Candidatus Micrarchaeota archaeon]|nr:class III signal peptide-containing protein [Candidatus Micrarchaeota archaeon]MBU2475965.1 class III signal peptide-containing protein [Candidatus Micrarchaeota archaeon]
MDNKAQPALEYLLLIGAAVLVAAIVIVVLGDIFGPTANQTKQTLNHWLTHIN